MTVNKNAVKDDIDELEALLKNILLQLKNVRIIYNKLNLAMTHNKTPERFSFELYSK